MLYYTNAEKKWGSQNFNFLNLKNLSPGYSFWGVVSHAGIISF